MKATRTAAHFVAGFIFHVFSDLELLDGGMKVSAAVASAVAFWLYPRAFRSG
jgi:hypothetical protein